MHTSTRSITASRTVGRRALLGALATIPLGAAIAANAGQARAEGPGLVIDVRDRGAAGDGITDDGPAIRAAVEEVAAAGGGTVRIPAGDYRLASPTPLNGNPAGYGFGRELVNLRSGVRIEGAGQDRVRLIVGEWTPTAWVVFRGIRVHDAGITGVTIHNTAVDPADTSYFDVVFLKSCTDMEISYNGTYDVIGWQFDLNITADGLENAPPEEWGRRIHVHDCRFTSLTEFHQHHDMLVENCQWDIDKAYPRPQWLGGNATQTAFKVSGKNAVQRNVTVRNSRIDVTGTGKPISLFEVWRGQDVTIHNLTTTGQAETTSRINSAWEKGPGTASIATQVRFEACDFESFRLALGEGHQVEFDRCTFDNRPYAFPGEVIRDDVDPTRQQSPTPIPTSLHLAHCELLGGGTLLRTAHKPSTVTSLVHCTLEHDESVAPTSLDWYGEELELVHTRLVALGTTTSQAIRSRGRGKVRFVHSNAVTANNAEIAKDTVRLSGAHLSVRFVHSRLPHVTAPDFSGSLRRVG